MADPTGRRRVIRIAILVATGAVWGARSLQALAQPASTNPASLFDWVAVIGFSAAFLLTAPALLILRASIHPGLNTTVAINVVATACLLAGVMDLSAAIGVEGLDAFYAIAALVAWLGMFVIAGMIAVSADKSLAFVPLLTGVGFALFEIGGGVLIMAGWWAFARILLRRSRRAAAAASSARSASA